MQQSTGQDTATSTYEHPHVLVVAALRSEARYVPSSLRVVVTGLGKVPAASAVTRALTAYEDPTRVTVLNIGTAGALRDGLDGLHEPGVVLNHDMNAEAVRALGIDPRERLVVGESDVVLASGDVFVTDPLVRERLAEQAHLVDMEGYAVAWVADSFGARVRMAKHVSDNADESAMEWPERVDASARVLGEWVEQVLPTLA